MADPWTMVGAFGNADEELVRRSGTEIVGVLYARGMLLLLRPVHVCSHL